MNYELWITLDESARWTLIPELGYVARMPILSPADAFERSLTQLMTKRQEHASALAEIDALFSRFGISVGGHREGNGVATMKRGPGRRPKAAAGFASPASTTKRAGGRHRRRSFSQTAEELVLSMLPASTSEINKKWKSAGRGGTADNTLTAMVKKKLVKRTPNAEGRGSTYAKA